MASSRFRRETVPILRSRAPGQNANSIRSLLRAVAIADRQAIQDLGGRALLEIRSSTPSPRKRSVCGQDRWVLGSPLPLSGARVAGLSPSAPPHKHARTRSAARQLLWHCMLHGSLRPPTSLPSTNPSSFTAAPPPLSPPLPPIFRCTWTPAPAPPVPLQTSIFFALVSGFFCLPSYGGIIAVCRREHASHHRVASRCGRQLSPRCFIPLVMITAADRTASCLQSFPCRSR